MGSGKSPIGASVPYVFPNGSRPLRTLIMCPGHLVGKWKREVEETIPGVKACILREVLGPIESGAFFPNPGSHCLDCPFQKPCQKWQAS